MAGVGSVEVVPHLEPVEVDAVAMLVERVTEADGVRPLSEHVTLHLRYGGDYDVRHVLVWAEAATGPRLAGYAHLDVTDVVEGSSAEMAVDPHFRSQGLGRLLARRLLAESPDGRLRLWAHGEHPAAGRLARELGFTRARVLWQMRRSLYAPLPSYRLPADVTIRAFHPGEDDEHWVALNAAAFVELPDQAGWTVADLHRRMAEPWFDPEGFLVAQSTSAPGPGAGDPTGFGPLVGFHWTKMHGGEAIHSHDGGPAHRHDDHGHAPIGEVYVVGVSPQRRGQGLGRSLTIAGLQHLRARGLPDAMLYVDAVNTAAIRVYESLGFTRWDTDVLYRR